MKLGSLPTFFHSSIANPSAHDAIDNGNVECKVLKADDDAREVEHEKTSVLESKSNGMYKDPLPSGKCNRDGVGNTQRPLSYIEADDSIGETTNESNNMVASYSNPNTGRELSQNETVFYTDKAVTQTELPELTICYNASSFNVVKDICIDEGVPSRDRIFTDKGKVDHRKIIDMLYSDLVGSGDLMKEGVDSFLPSSEDGKFVNGSYKEVEKRHREDNLLEEVVGDVNATDDGQLISGVNHKRVTMKGNPKMSIEEEESNVDAREKIVNYTFDEHVMPDKSLLLRARNFDGRHYYSSELPVIDQQAVEGHDTNKIVDVDLRPLGATKGTKLATSTSPSANEISLGCNNTKDLLFDRRVENGSITFDFNSSSSAKSARMEGAETADHQHSAQNFSMSGLEDKALDSLTGSTRSFFIQHGYGESDHSGSVSDPITYSGLIPYSGNTSLRSESSTASTRSFAFPVLQSEWNSSPVKMAKPDRRQLKRHRGWWISVLCCKF
ncbi:hypothetical protein AAC387_Pa09g0870 [Persea americana]